MQHQDGHNVSALHSAPAASNATDDVPELDQRLISASSKAPKSQQRPVRPLTVPKEFNLSTSKRSTRQPNAAKQEWKSLAQLVREFQTKTPPRFRRVPRNTQPVTSHFSPHTTEPKSPTLHTALRHGQSTPSSSDATQVAGGSSFVAVAERAMLFSNTLRKAHNPYHSSSLWSVGTHSAVFSSNRGGGHHHQLSPLAHSIDASDLTHQGHPFGLHSVPVDAFNKLQITIPEDTQQLLDPPAMSSSPSFARNKPSRPAPLSLRHSLPSFSPYPVLSSPAATASPKPTTPLRRSTQTTPALTRSAPAKPTNAFPRTPTSRGARSAHPPSAHTASPLTRSAPAHPYTPPTRPPASRTSHLPTPSSAPALRRWSSSTKTTSTPSPSAASKLNRSTPSPLAAARPRTPLSHTKPSTTQSPHTSTTTALTPKSAQRPRPLKPAGPPSRLPAVSPRPAHLSPIATSSTKPARAQAPPTTPKPTTRAPMTPPFSAHRPAIRTSHPPTPESSPAPGECPQPSTPDKPLPDSLHPHPWSASASTVGDPSDPSDGLTDPSSLLDLASARTTTQSPTAPPPANDSPILSAIRHADAAFTWDHALGFDEDEEDHPRHPNPPPAAAPAAVANGANGVAASLSEDDVAGDSTLLDAAAAEPFPSDAPTGAAELLMEVDNGDEVGPGGAPRGRPGGGTPSPVTAHPVEADELDVWTVRDQGEAAAVAGDAPVDVGKAGRRRRLWVLDQEPSDDGEGSAFD